MKISARNVFEGQVASVVSGPVNAEVTLALVGGERIVAVVTQASVRSLGLAVGVRAYAIVKAPWVIVATGDGGPRFSDRNQLAGTVSSVKSGPINAEVEISLPGGAAVQAIITREAAEELGLATGVAARAIIKASHVVLAV